MSRLISNDDDTRLIVERLDHIITLLELLLQTQLTPIVSINPFSDRRE